MGKYLFILLLTSLGWKYKVHGHGRLMDPPGRNAMWRFGYPIPENYDDNQLWCGNAASMFNSLLSVYYNIGIHAFGH